MLNAAENMFLAFEAEEERAGWFALNAGRFGSGQIQCVPCNLWSYWMWGGGVLTTECTEYTEWVGPRSQPAAEC